MRRAHPLAKIVPAILLVFQTVSAQQKPVPTKAAQQATVKNRPCASGTQIQTCERGWQLIDVAEAEVVGLRESGARAYEQLIIAEAYASGDRKKSVDLLNSAFTTTLGLSDGSKDTAQGKIEATEKADLQREVLEELVTLAPEIAEEKLPLAVPSVREAVFSALIGFYQKTKRLDAALETFNRIARDAGFPYVAASRLMTALPSEKAAERQQLFAEALNSFRANPPAPNELGFDAAEFPDLIVQQWKGLPAGLVREAIDEVLKQADTQGDDAQPIRLSVGYARGGAASLSSMYEYRLFQLLPVLQHIDPDSAETLLRDHEAVAKQFDAYLQAGSPSIRFVSPSRSGVPLRQGHSQVSAPSPGENPQEVVQRIMTLQDAGTRARFLLATARSTRSSDPPTAKACLDQLISPVAAQLQSVSEQVSILSEATGLYIDLGEVRGATQAISAARTAADKLYAADKDLGNPNKALTVYWPSTSAYLRLVRLATRVSPDLALAMIKEMDDEEIRPLMRLALAGTWIGVPVGSTTVINKDASLSQTSGPV